MRTISSFIHVVIFAFSFSSLFAQEQELKSDSLDVLHYSIHLNNIDFTNDEIEACTEIKITPKENGISAIAFDLLQLNIDNIEVDGTTVSTHEYDDTLLVIPLAAPIGLTDTLDVEICYSGSPQIESYGWGGFHIDANSAYNLGVAFAADPHNYGRVWFPCFDEFKDRATYDIYTTVNESKTVVCGGELIEEVNNGNGTKTVHWSLDKSIPTYLASVVIDDYELITENFNGVEKTFPLDIYVRSNNVDDAEGTFANLPQIVEAFEYYFGAYPWNRVGYVGTTNGSMEHATNIAFVRSAINGTLSEEWLVAHELSHMWFGDKVTCASAWDMWLNEGWAVFCESLYKEYLYGKEAYNIHQRAKQYDVLRNCHNADGDYYPVYGLPHDLTYGETVYQKGGCVVHTMRGYLGDEKFFSTVKAYLEEFAYDYASSEDMKDFFSIYSGVDMTDFFDSWVYAEGFTHFSIDSFDVVPSGSEFDVDVYMRQKLHHAPEFYNSNRVEITFMNDDWDTYVDTLFFSGETGHNTYTLPFEPDFVLVDLNNNMIDAMVDEAQVIKNTGEHEFLNCIFTADIQGIEDSAFMHVMHNWVAPDTMKVFNEDYVFSSKRYYRIEGIFPDNFIVNGQFGFNLNGLDNDIVNSINDSITLLHRRDATDEWEEMDCSVEINLGSGQITCPNILPGEYTIAGKLVEEGVKPLSPRADNEFMKVFPNPSDNGFNFAFNNLEKSIPSEHLRIEIYDINGKLIREIPVHNAREINWVPISKTAGIYYVNLMNAGQVIQTEKIIYKK